MLNEGINRVMILAANGLKVGHETFENKLTNSSREANDSYIKGIT